jgi:hypothetical protein
MTPTAFLKESTTEDLIELLDRAQYGPLTVTGCSLRITRKSILLELTERKTTLINTILK